MIYTVFAVALCFLGFFVWYLAATDDRSRRLAAVATTLTLMAVCALSIIKWDAPAGTPWSQRINLKKGLDIKGGTEFLVELGGEPSAAARDQAVAVIRKRIDGMGMAEPVIQPAGDNRIIVQIPGVSEADKAVYRNQLQRVAKLEFRRVHPESAELLFRLDQGKGTIPFDHEVLNMVEHKAEGRSDAGRVVVKKRPELGGKAVRSAFRNVDHLGLPTVVVNFTSEGSRVMEALTTGLMREYPGQINDSKRRIAIVLDNEVYSAPVVQAVLSDNCTISGGSMTPREAEELASVLQNPLETPVRILDERGVDPSLGKASVRSGFIAGLIGLALVVIFMVIYYHLSGLISVLALGVNLFVLIGLLAQFGFTLTMPGVAALVLTIGMAVDANVLVFERIREELSLGKPVGASVQAGFGKAFSSILDANVTTILAAVVLYVYGTGPIKGFAVVLCLGVLSSMFGALIVTRAGYDWLLHKVPVKKLSMLQLVGATRFDFFRYRWVAIAGSIILLLAGLQSALQRGNSALGVDFAGGDLATYSFTTKVDSENISRTVGSSVRAQYQRTAGEENELLTIRSPFGTADAIEAQLTAAYPEAGLKRIATDKVEGVIGKELANKAVLAFTLGMLAIFAYTAVRFEMAFAVGAIVALLHDVLISLGVFLLLGRELSLPIVGAILTVAGYSINDTIVVFDRIREGLRTGMKGSLREVMNDCINLTLSRTILTSTTTLLAVAALYVFGGVVINDFALVMIVGVLAGTYSTIFIAAPIAYWLSGNRRESKASEPVPAV
jgi:SecD/SecF fusion protein